MKSQLIKWQLCSSNWAKRDSEGKIWRKTVETARGTIMTLWCFRTRKKWLCFFFFLFLWLVYRMVFSWHKWGTLSKNARKCIQMNPFIFIFILSLAQKLHNFYIYFIFSMFYKTEIWNSHFKKEAMCSWLIMFCKNRTMCRSLYPDCEYNAFRNCCFVFFLTRINTPQLPPCKHPDRRSCCLKHYGHCVLQACKTDIFMLVTTSWKQDVWSFYKTVWWNGCEEEPPPFRLPMVDDNESMEKDDASMMEP